jgi:hypothetical protein
MDPLKPNKNLFFLWTKTSNKSVKHNHQSTRPLYKIIRREILMSNERERRNWLKVSIPNKYANGHCHHSLSRDVFFPLLFYFCFCFNRFKYSRRWGNIPAAALPNAAHNLRNSCTTLHTYKGKYPLHRFITSLIVLAHTKESGHLLSTMLHMISQLGLCAFSGARHSINGKQNALWY